MKDSYIHGKRFVFIGKGDEIYNDDGLFVVEDLCGRNDGSGLVCGLQIPYSYRNDVECLDRGRAEECRLTPEEIGEMIYHQNPYGFDRPYRVKFDYNETED